MNYALEDAQLPCDAISYVNAHGTATKLNDAVETQAIKDVFGAHAMRLAVSSSKAAVGHMVGAAGAMGLLLSVMALERLQVPPTANLMDADPDCDLDYVPRTGRDVSHLSAAMCNAFGFGGSSATLIVTRPQ
jgi:3-oxoacyl-(acyl-carrier-protein) synthase